MRTRLTSIVSALAVVVAAGAVSAEPSASAGPPSSTPAPTHRLCSTPKPKSGRFGCMALERTTSNGVPLTAPADDSTPPGYGPAQIQSAYQLAEAAASRGADQTVAITDAYDDPTAEADLAHYRSTYSLPPCTSDDGCFRKVNQDGAAAPLPAVDPGWAGEISLDLDMVSATCPHCHILLVEADDNGAMSLGATVATAAKLGAKEISNSWGAPEFAGEASLEPFFDQPGVMITASTGDAGYGVSYPAASANVTAVGGTSLWPSSGSRGWSEAAWALAGSGCSAQIRKPAWQHDACTHRTVGDVAAVADPDTPVAAYDTTGAPGWLEVGGTSVASPIIASVYALIGNATGGGSYFYQHRDKLFDVTSAHNGTCSPSYLCTAVPGYDGPTGLGTPDLTGKSDTGGSCVNGWSVAPQQQSLPDVVTTPFLVQDRANGIDALSPTNVWTVGTYLDEGATGPAASFGFITDVEHWDGKKWSKSPSPSPVTPSGYQNAQFQAVSFDSPKDGWAVGVNANDGINTTVLVSHWDGSRWSLSPALNPWTTAEPYYGQTIATRASANSVTAITPNDVWIAVNSDTASTFEHWNGSTWTVVDPPQGDSTPNLIPSMHAFSANDVWATGVHFDNLTGSESEPVIMHWDGTSWSVSKLDPATTSDAAFTSISGSSPDDVWAVGSAIDPAVNTDVPISEHWDGHSWKIVTTVDGDSVASNKTMLYGVTAISPSDAWAVGKYAGTRAGQTERQLYLLEHWDGHAWTIVSSPQSAVPDGLWAISASSAGNVWIAGSEQLSTWDQFTPYPWILRNGCGNG